MAISRSEVTVRSEALEALQRGGGVEAAGLPRTFPESEWLRIFAAALPADRSDRIEESYANLRVPHHATTRPRDHVTSRPRDHVTVFRS